MSRTSQKSNLPKGMMEKIFQVDPRLEIVEELVGFHAINPFVPNDSSARSYMMSLHMSQALTIENGEEKIIQTGLEKQFGDNTFSKKIPADSHVLKVIYRYRGISANSVNAVTEVIVIFEDNETGIVDYMSIPYNFSLHQYFGFKYRWNTELISKLTPGTFIPKDTILADSPSVAENSGYKFGRNVNVLLQTIRAVAEDGVVISKSLSENLSYKIFETRTVEFGADKFPLNIYGDFNNYKPFPDIGETINDDSVIMVLRKYNPRLSPALLSKLDVMDFDPTFDEAVYVKSPGSIETIDGYEVVSGKVVDIVSYHSPKYKGDVYTGTVEGVTKYVDGYKIFHKDILEAYEEIEKDHYKKYKRNDLRVSERFQRLLIDSYAIVNPDNHNIAYSFRNEPIDIYRMVFTIEYTVKAGVGAKITDLHGGKGIIIEVRDDELMPVDKFGNRADAIMDSTSTPSRMNSGRLYEQYFNAISRHVKRLVIEKLKSYSNGALLDIRKYSDTDCFNAFEIVCELMRIIGTEQSDVYDSLLWKDIDSVRMILDEIVNKELYVIYKVSSKYKPYQIVSAIRNTKFEPPIDNIDLVDMESGDIKESIDHMMIGPLYMILLGKTADNYLSTASAKTNHYSLPIGVGNVGRTRLPFRNSPVKILSETEGRLYTAYGSRVAIAELKDRANSLDTHAHVYRNILNADRPTNIHRVVDRNVIPFGNDNALELVHHIFNAGGIKISYVPDKYKISQIKKWEVVK